MEKFGIMDTSEYIRPTELFGRCELKENVTFINILGYICGNTMIENDIYL